MAPSIDPAEVQIGDRTFRVRPLTMGAVPRVQAWLQHQPRPVELAHLKSELAGLPPEAIRDAIAGAVAALGSWPPQYPYDDRAWRLISGDIEGLAVWLHAALYPEHKDLTVAECKVLIDDLDFRSLREINEALHPAEATEEMRWRAALSRLAPQLTPDVVDRVVRDATGADDDPKGEPGAGAHSPTAGSTASSAA